METLGEFVRAARDRLRLEQKTLAKAIGLTPSSISQIEANRQFPQLETLQKIANELRIPIEELIARAPWIPIGDVFNLEQLAASGALRGLASKSEIHELSKEKKHLVELIEHLPEKDVEPVLLLTEALIERVTK